MVDYGTTRTRSTAVKAGYDSINRTIRAAQHRRDAAELDKAGFPLFAEINREMAALLDPPKSESKDDNVDNHYRA